jgi:hypothetical protein
MVEWAELLQMKGEIPLEKPNKGKRPLYHQGKRPRFSKDKLAPMGSVPVFCRVVTKKGSGLHPHPFLKF